MKLILVLSCFFILSSVYAQFAPGKPLTWERMTFTDIRVGDTDSDGDIDIFVANHYSGIKFYQNIGPNNYREGVYLAEGYGYIICEALDFDLDGDIDLIASNQSDGKINLFENVGTNEFTETVIFDDPGTSPQNLHVSDLDMDGDLDISFTSTVSGHLRWLENNGDDSFSVDDIIEPELAVTNYTFLDADLDGDMDIIAYDNFYSVIIYIEQTAPGTFTAPVTIGVGTYLLDDIKAYDRDGDGDKDIFFAEYYGNRIGYIENTGGGTFGGIETIIELTTPSTVDFVDVDVDGEMDIITNIAAGYNLTWIRGIGGGDFAPGGPMVYYSDVNAVDFADCDGDGDLDIIRGTDELILNENIAGETFGENQYIGHFTLQPYYNHAVDMDGDGDLDLFVASSTDNKISYIENLGEGQFKDPVIVTRDLENTQYVSTSDLDGDGDLDVLATSTSNDQIVWYENLGDGNFSDVHYVSWWQDFPSCIIAEDWDGDGDNDIVVSSTYDSQVKVYQNYGDGSFDEDGVSITVTGQPLSLNANDFDADGDMDIALVSKTEGRVIWLENTGGLEFEEHIITDAFPTPSYLDLFDIDDDDDLDLLATSETSGTVVWFENLGGGDFGGINLINTGGESPTVATYADMNNDGLKDVIIGSSSYSSITWYENTGDAYFSDDGVIIVDDIDYIKHLSAADWDGDGDQDLIGCSNIKHEVNFYENMILTSHSVKGTIYLDLNENGVKDDDEAGINFAPALSTPESYYAFTGASGDYNIAFDETEFGDYTIYPQAIDYWSLSTATSYDVTIDGEYTLYEDLDFGFSPSSYVHDIDPTIVGGIPRIDRVVKYSLDYSNIGSTVPSGSIHLKLDDELTFISADIAPEIIEGQNLYWTYEELDYFEDRKIDVTVLMPNFESLGNEIRSYFTVNVDSVGGAVYTIMDSLDQVIQGAYDPNDKSVRPAGEGEFGYIDPETETLEYLIRFQNTGTDTAFNVVIKDQLDPNLDWPSLTPLAWSHDMEIEVNHEGEVSFIFDNIMLPDSNVNQLASNGFVKFEIDLLPGLPLETSIYNTAGIYFDFNPAVVTNTTVSTLHEDDTDNSEISEEEISFASVYPNPFSDYTTVTFSEELHEEYTFIVYDILGGVVYKESNLTGTSVKINKDALGEGMFILTILNSQSGEVVYHTKLTAQ